MKIIRLTFAFLLLFNETIYAQDVKYVMNGAIEYTKTINMYALLKRVLTGTRDQALYEEYKKTQPQFLTMNSKLSFSSDKALFEPAAPDIKPYYMFVAQNNIIYTDLHSRQVIVQKDLLGETYLLKDALRTISWKITDETRDIEGFSCRRANGVIMDSIYVVAFFATDIPISSGPESFIGLPGMILQVSLPHENITWLATKITETPIPLLTPPVKGKLTNNDGLRSIITPALQRYGNAKYLLLKSLLL